jgi:RNA polymerase sigma-70 factor (ECF subfamily)
MELDSDELIPTRWTLIGRLKNIDDQESWREFFNIYWKLIYGVARKCGLTPADAQDVVQDTVLRVCKKMPEFKADPAHGSFKGWLLWQTRGRILDQIRKRKPEAVARKHYSQDSSETPTEERVPDPTGNALEQIWDNEWERNLISRALEKLECQVNSQHYQIFVLYAIKQHSPQQVAKVAGVKTNEVYLIKNRLMPHFKQAIKQIEENLT